MRKVNQPVIKLGELWVGIAYRTLKNITHKVIVKNVIASPCFFLLTNCEGATIININNWYRQLPNYISRTRKEGTRR